MFAVADLGHVSPTGRTQHTRDGVAQDSAHFAHLALAAYDETDDVYLFYCDDDWVVLNETCHTSRAQAEEQAQLEFEGVRFRDVA